MIKKKIVITGGSGRFGEVIKRDFDRSKYNVRFRSGTFFDDLGDKLILNDINVDVSLVAVNK